MARRKRATSPRKDKDMGKKYSIFPLKATDKAELFDATAEELRLLIALIERGGDADEDALAKSASLG